MNTSCWRAPLKHVADSVLAVLQLTCWHPAAQASVLTALLLFLCIYHNPLQRERETRREKNFISVDWLEICNMIKLPTVGMCHIYAPFKIKAEMWPFRQNSDYIYMFLWIMSTGNNMWKFYSRKKCRPMLIHSLVCLGLYCYFKNKCE